MASGISRPPLPLSARKLERRFLDLPNTQPNPDFGLGAPRVLSVTDVLVQQAGTRPVPEPSSLTLMLLAMAPMYVSLRTKWTTRCVLPAVC
jgi:hypothetical protein